MDLLSLFVKSLVIFTIVIISSLPLYITVNFLGGNISIFKAFFVMAIIAFASFLIELVLHAWGVFLSWIVLIFVFKYMFNLSWFGSFVVWFLWIIVVWVFSLVFGLFGFEYERISLFL